MPAVAIGSWTVAVLVVLALLFMQDRLFRKLRVRPRHWIAWHFDAAPSRQAPIRFDRLPRHTRARRRAR